MSRKKGKYYNSIRVFVCIYTGWIWTYKKMRLIMLMDMNFWKKCVRYNLCTQEPFFTWQIQQELKRYIFRPFFNKISYSIGMMIPDIIQKKYHLLVCIMLWNFILKKTQNFQSFLLSLLNTVLPLIWDPLLQKLLSFLY